MPNEIQSKFPRYNLFIYGEGSYAQSLIDMGEDLQLDGVPVVFVHGNAGRYKQVHIIIMCFLKPSFYVNNVVVNIQLFIFV